MERETQLEIAVGVLGVGSFILALLLIGSRYGVEGLDPEAGTALIGAMAGFVIGMTALGYWLSRQRS
jgi:hypothetical protein